MQFAREHQHWSMDDWKKVIWINESSFEIGKISRQTRVWHRTSEKFNNSCLAPTFKSRRTSMMVWGAFTGSHKYPLVIMPTNRRSAHDFVEIVYEGALSGFYFLHDCLEDLILMEDGALVHRALLPNQWKETHGMKKLAWPANSPDLNSIENLRKIIKDHIQNKSIPKNREGLVESLQRAWEWISIYMLDVLISTMPHRMNAVISAKGRSTRW
jgi:hypothetical protein